MKKQILISFIMLLCCTAVNAIGDRYFEIGSNVEFGVGNSYISFSDLFFNESKVLTLDFNKMADITSVDGFEFGGFVNADAFLNFNFGKKLSIGLFAGIDGDMYTNVPGSLFSLISKGNTLGETTNGEFDIKASIFAEAAVDASFKTGKIRIGLRPSLFLPVVYARGGSADYSVVTNTDGTAVAAAKWEVPVYSVFDISDGFSMNNFPLSELMQIGGIDLGVSVTYDISSMIVLTTTISNIPIIPSICKYQTIYSGAADFKLKSMLESMDNGSDLVENSSSSNDPVTEEVNEKIYRPFEIGLSAELRPFAIKSVSIVPAASLVFDNGLIDYSNFGVTGKFDLNNMFKASVFILQRQHMWKTGMTAGINLRVIELDFLISAYFPVIETMFSGTGLCAGVGFRLGI